MTARERLEAYLDALRRRLRVNIYAQAAAVALGGTLLITCLAVWLLKREQFALSIVLIGRSALVLFLFFVAALLLWLPLRRLICADGADILEQRLPEQGGRIQTYLDSKRREAEGITSPLTELLAADAANIASRTAVAAVVPTRRIGMSLAIGAAALLALALLLSIGPTYWGLGSRHLLLGMELPRTVVPVRRVTVMPGDATVRRNSDLAIHASVEGFDPEHTQVFVRFADQPQWERAPMQPVTDSSFEFKLYAVRGPLQYYVDADGTKSGEHKVAVVDLPKIERVRLTYSYPQWTGLPANVDETSRDISAVTGTEVKVEIFADAPLNAPALIVDGQSDVLTQDGKTSTGTIQVTKAGRYQIGARVADEFVALSDEYPIDIVPDEKPTIGIQKPGRDWRATSIEEVPVRVQAQDDFRLRDVSLRYSVNGGEWRSLPIGGGAKRTDSESLLRLEDLGAQATTNPEQRLVPGDLVSYYAVARDRKQTVETDLFMVQVQPFERRFSQAQGGGGGGGGMGEEQGQISDRQREILLATWNLRRKDERNERSREQLEDSAKMLAELQTTLAQQARTLAERTRARTMGSGDERVKTFVESLDRAASVMDPAARHLSQFQLQEAVPIEQQALQQLLRAEAAFREVQISMEQNNAGGDGSQTARNFTEMFELEMDLEKNQYESESQLSTQNVQRDVDDAIRKLKELAERQEKLAQEQNRSALRSQEQRWKQEQLRREAEDLRRRLAEMDRQQRMQASSSERSSQNQSGQSQSSQGQSSQDQSSRDQSGQGQSGQSRSERSRGDPSRSEQRGDERSRSEVARALDSVNKALEQMRSANAGAEQNADQSAQSAREAGRNLRQALQQMDRHEPSRLDEVLDQFADRTERMADEQRRIESDLYSALSEAGEAASAQRMNGRAAIDQRRAQQLVRAKQQMSTDLTALQSDMRSAVHEHRKQAPKSAQRLGEILHDMEGSEVMYRLSRSAAEIYYGRAREAAPREGLITEALDTLEMDLREAATQAGREKQGTPEGVTPDALLAEVAELRRALEESQRAGAQGESQRSRSQERAPGSQSGSRGSESPGSESSGEQSGEEAANAGSMDRSSRGGPAGEYRENLGLSAWNPVAPSGSFSNLEDGRGSLAQQATGVSQRIRDLANRMNRGQLSQAELDALRRAAHQLRRLSGDPLAEQQAMLKLIDQIELTALAASARARDSASARSATPAPDSPRYREAVAEYYRRLGDR